jgi:hypothetical protein
VNISTRRRSSRRVVPTSSTGTPLPPPTATLKASTRRQSRSRRQSQLQSTETSEAPRDDSDEFDDAADDDDDDGDLPRPSWEDRLSELADYRKIHGHRNVPYRYNENKQLSYWVRTQRNNYGLHLEGKQSTMTALRIQALESLGFEWDCLGATWEDRLSELADYRKIHGHCNVPYNNSESIQLGRWVGTQRGNYRLHQEGNRSPQMTLSRIQALENLGFEWDSHGAAWEYRLSELTDYRKIHGHCNVPNRYIENIQLVYWVTTQRRQYRLHAKGKKSPMTALRIQKLEILGFEWDSQGAAWEDRLGELADYRKLHGHCNVPRNYGENTKLGEWVRKQRRNYRLHREGKASPMTALRIQSLETLGFELTTTAPPGKTV